MSNEQQQENIEPFKMGYSASFANLLYQLKITLAFSTYQAGKVIFISSLNEQEVMQLPRNFKKPMGIAVDDNQLAIASMREVHLFINEPSLSSTYPKMPAFYDGMYAARATYYCGECDMHDLAWIDDKLIAVNTHFSCISEIGRNFSFVPIWQPHFITELQPEDRCHLNGLVVINNKPKYVTALGQSNEERGWKTNLANGGILMDIETNEILLDDLCVPHSPKMIDGKLYILESGKGTLSVYDPETKIKEEVLNVGGFGRGMAEISGYLFICLSKLRKNSSSFGKLPVSEMEYLPGIVVYHLPSKKFVAELRYETSVEEIYDLQIITNARRPGIITHDNPMSELAISTPFGSFWKQPEPEQN